MEDIGRHLQHNLKLSLEVTFQDQDEVLSRCQGLPILESPRGWTFAQSYFSIEEITLSQHVDEQSKKEKKKYRDDGLWEVLPYKVAGVWRAGLPRHKLPVSQSEAAAGIKYWAGSTR